MSAYPEVLLRDLNNGKQELIAPAVRVLPNGEESCIPTGYVTDWASIPRWATPLFPRLGRHNRAVLWHDFFYQYQYYDRATVDRWMRIIAIEDGTRPTRAWAMWVAVRVGGIKGWNDTKRIKYKYKGG